MQKKLNSIYIAPIVVLAVFCVLFAENGFYPFGNASISWCDMNQQVIPLFCNFKDILSGESGLFLNLNNAGGMNFFGVFFFFLASPFSFLVLFFEKGDIPLLMNVIMILKLCLCATTAGIYFEKSFPRQSAALKIILSVNYAFCGYALMFYQNIMWLDLVYLFPLVMLGIDILIKENKPHLLLISLTLCTILNFYLSYCVYIFIIVFFGIYTFSKNIENKIVYLKLGITALCALLTSAVVSIPSFIQYSSSGRTLKIAEELKYCDFFTHTETTLAAILSSGIVFAVLLILIPRFYEQNKRIKSLIIVFLALLVPMLIEPVNRMWHTGSYMSFPVRFGFIAVFVGLTLCGEYLETETVFQIKSNKLYFVFSVLVSLFIARFMLNYSKENSDALTNFVETLWGDEDSFDGLVILCSAAIIGYLTALILAKKKHIGKNALAISLSIVLLAEAICSVMIYIVPAKTKLNVEKYQSFVDFSDEIKDDSFYRVNIDNKFTDANMTGAIGYNSLGHYTSFTRKDYMNAAKKLGYSGYWMEIGNWGGNVLSDALMSVKYTVNQYGKSFYADKNDNVLGLGFAVDSVPREIANGNRLEVLGKTFAQMFSLKTNPVTVYKENTISGCSFEKNDTNTFVNHGNGTITYNLKITKREHLYFDCFDGASNALVEHVNDSFKVTVNNKTVSNSYPSQDSNGTLYLGEFENQNVTIVLNLLKDVTCYSFGIFGVDANIVEEVVEAQKSFDFNITANHLTAEIDNSFSGNIFLSLPYNEGYRITLDGEKLDYQKALTGFTSLHLSKGGTLKITLIPKGFVLGAVISGFGVLLSVLFLLFHKKLEPISVIIKNSVFVLFMVVFVVTIFVIYIFPILQNLL